MKHIDGVAVAGFWLVTALAACNGRFDFDTELDAAADSDVPFIGILECGGETCHSATQLCCLDSTGSHCVDALAACSGVSIPCDDPSDCSQGKACCSEERSAQVVHVECEDATSCLSKGHVLLCSPRDPGACSGGTCAPTTQTPLPPGYHQCN
jgi:hypothetical protein